MVLRGRGWLRALFRRRLVEREMHEEMRDHLDQATDLLIARGLTRDQARDQARREFGNLGCLEEEARDARGVRWVEDAAQDVRFGLRSLGRSPAFTIVAVLSLALGIGVNTAIFTVIDAVMQPRIVHDPGTFVSIPQSWSKPAYDYLAVRTPAMSDVIARSDERVLLAPTPVGGEPTRASVELVSGNYFAALHATMLLGRNFGSNDPRVMDRDPVAVLNYRFWKIHFSGDSLILGRVVRLANGTAFTVIGIAARDFSGVRRGGPDLWLPLGMRPALPIVTQGLPPRGDWFGANGHPWLTLYGRLANRHTADEAQVQVNLALRQLTAADSSVAPGLAHAPFAVTTAEASAGRNQSFLKTVLLAATFIVLLVACFNVASLMLARAADRQREIAVRLCLGASRARIVRQLIAESAIVVGAGATLAFVLSAATLRTVALSGGLAFITDDDPERLARALRPGGWVFGFALGLSALSVVVCGLMPALRATRPDLASAVKADRAGIGGSRFRMRTALTVAQVALALVLLLSAGVLTRSLARALSLDVGFDRARVLTVSSTLRLTGYDTARVQSLSRAFEERVRAFPGVRAVARGDIPLVGGRFRTTLTVPGVAPTQREGYLAAVTPAYFAALGIPIVRGRAFTDAELRARAQVIVVSEATARLLWPSDDPIGMTVKVDPKKKGLTAPETVMPLATVIGVARDAQMVNFGEIPSVYVYLPSASGELLIRADDDAGALAGLMREVARAIDPNVVVSAVPLGDLIVQNGSVYEVRFAAGFAGAIGVLALVLASVGLFGLMAYTVAQRTREVGVRMALGANASDVVSLIMRRGLRVVAIGAAIGLVCGAAGSRLLSAMLFGMSPLDPFAYAGAVLLLTVVAVAACYVPVRRATRVDPLIALKAD